LPISLKPSMAQPSWMFRYRNLLKTPLSASASAQLRLYRVDCA
jgi:hypothetical protein